MSRAALHGTCVAVSLLAAIGCEGYLDGSLQAAQDASLQKPTPAPANVPLTAPPARPRPVPASAPDAGEARREPDAMIAPNGPSMPDAMIAPSQPSAMMNMPDAMLAPDAMSAPAPPAPPRGNLRIAHSARFDAYLTDALGRALYMYVRDQPGSPDSACLADCAQQWPPFDMATVDVDAPLEAADVTRFHRQDGAFQTAYKGHPLYYRAAELGLREVTADGLDLRWFVARDYLLFMATAKTFAPLGGSAGDGLYLTDGFGRALYVCLDDLPRMAATPAESSCDADCAVQRPIFDAAQTDRTTRLPSVLDAFDLNELVRPDGLQQLTYRGWPLYYFSGDLPASVPQGHNETAWRALDPVQFGSMEQPDLPEP
jgi:predicted lipoprotein with Yx(FWY)xxD motif